MHVWEQGGKSVHALHSHMSALKFCTKPSYDCSGKELSDNAFVWASKCIRGRHVVEEFVSCGVQPLAAGVNFDK
jgi:hypothetical protein